MILFPNAKINLGLNIIRKRPDGYHDLETFFCPVNLCDALEVIPQNSQILPEREVIFSQSGINIEGNPEDNICVKAWKMLKKDFPNLPGISMHLHKVIPTGAGLGGGSADGAFTLALLNDLFHLNITKDKLKAYALQLGSDCPFFIINEPCLAKGQGEILEPISIDLSAYEILLVDPGIHISTAKAFSGVTTNLPEKSIFTIIQQPVSTWRTELVNDFEAAIFPQFPEISEIKNNLYHSGAIYASLTGSGSAVYGIFEKGNLPKLIFPVGYQVFHLKPTIS
ncbi:MAG: 4-(cytidine 5'-diphospho)-2-C-methyl-D-erythritol kinase [Chitinophagaceae bacterium]